MSEELKDELESKTEPTEEVDKTEAVEDESTTEDSEDLEAIKEKNKRLFERAKKAEAEAKLLKAERLKAEEQAKAKAVPQGTVPSQKQEGLTPIDTIALINAKVYEKDDIEFVAEYAQFKKIPVSEAIKSSVVKSELAQRSEQRQTAEATNTGAARRGASKPSDEQILQNVSLGKFPEDPEELARVRYNAKLKK